MRGSNTVVPYLVDPTIGQMLPPELNLKSETAKRCCVADDGVTNLIASKRKGWREVVKRATFHVHFFRLEATTPRALPQALCMDRLTMLYESDGGYTLCFVCVKRANVGSRFTCKTVKA